MENIGLQDSLLSRFDLLFVMLDVIDSDHDRMISDHVVRMHRYRNPKEQDGDVLPMGVSAVDMLSTINPDTLEDKETPMYEKYDPLLHGASRKRTDQILSMEFMRKYIHIAKCLKPKLTETACEMISNEYSRLRSQDLMDSDVARTQPVTARTLETLIRLSTAHAKARMSRSVAEQDAQAAIELIQFAYFKKVLEKEKKKRRRTENDDSQDEMEDDEEEAAVQEETAASQGTRRSKRTRVEHHDDSDHEELLTSPPDRGDLTRRTTITSPRVAESATMDTEEAAESSVVAISEARLKLFRQGVFMAFKHFHDQSVSLARLTTHINENSGDEAFTPGEITAAVNQMTESNNIMVHDDMVFLI